MPLTSTCFPPVTLARFLRLRIFSWDTARRIPGVMNPGVSVFHLTMVICVVLRRLIVAIGRSEDKGVNG